MNTPRLVKTICMVMIVFFSCNVLSKPNALGNADKIVGNNSYIDENRKTNDIKSIYIKGSMDVEYSVGNTSTIHIYGESNIIPLLETKNEDGELYIGFKSDVSVTYHKLKIRIQSPNIDKIRIKGSGNFNIPSSFSAKKLKAEIDGSGNINIEGITNNEMLDTYIHGSGDIYIRNIQAEKIKAEIRGSGDINLEGNGKEAEYRIYGSGDIEATKLLVEKINAEIDGSGDIRCNAKKEIEGWILGSGDIRYKGNPTKNNIKINGSGDASSF